MTNNSLVQQRGINAGLGEINSRVHNVSQEDIFLKARTELFISLTFPVPLMVKHYPTGSIYYYNPQTKETREDFP